MKFAIMAFLLLGAGCLAPAPPSESPVPVRLRAPPTAAGEDPPTKVIVEDENVVRGGFGVAAGDVVQTQAMNGAWVWIPRNATHVRIQLDWISFRNETDLDMRLTAPAFDGSDTMNRVRLLFNQTTEGVFANYDGSFQRPDSPSRLEVDAATFQPHNACNADPCRWNLRVFVDGPGKEVEWVARITVAREAFVPAPAPTPRLAPAQDRTQSAAAPIEAPLPDSSWALASPASFLAALALAAHRVWGSRILGWIVGWGLFARKTTEEILDHPYRQQLLDAIQREPGLSAHELHERVGGTYRNAIYHLTVLQSRSLVARLHEGRHRRFVAVEAVRASDRRAYALARNASARRVLERVQGSPDSTLSDLRAALGLAASTLSWQLARLRDAGLVERILRNGEVRFQATRLAAHVMK